MRTVPGEERDFLWIRPVRQLCAIIFKKNPQTNKRHSPTPPPQKNPNPTNPKPTPLTKPFSHLHYCSFPRPAWKKQKVGPNLMLLGWRNTSLKSDVWEAEGKEKAVGKREGTESRQLIRDQSFQMFSRLHSEFCSSLCQCSSAWEWRASPVSGSTHQLRRSG